MEVAKGNIPGHSFVIVRGHNPSQSAASGFVDIGETGDLTYLTSAETMEIASSSASDAAAGIGLRTLLVQGVDGTGAAIQEIVTLNGTSDVQTVNSYLRVNTMAGLTAGSAGWNLGIVAATATTAATVQAAMNVTESISQGSHYTVPLAKTLFPVKVELNAAKIVGGGNPEVEFRGYARLGGAGAAWIQLFDKKMDTAVMDEVDILFPFPVGVPIARTDIRIRADTDTNNTEVRTRVYGILVDD